MEALMVETSASEPRERLVAFVDEVVRRLPHVRQRENALLYVRGLIEQGGRKSLQPTLFRLQETPARYESMQQFLADSPWDPALSVRAVGERGSVPLGFSLYLPQEWCDDRERRRQAKIPDELVFQSKPQLAAALCERAAGWRLPAAPILADCDYGDDRSEE